MSGTDQSSVTTEPARLRASLEALAFAFDASLDLVLAVDADGLLMFANPAAKLHFPSLEVGARAAALFGDSENRFRAAEAQLLEHGQSARFEWGEHGPGGVRGWFGCTLSPLGERGSGYLCIASDTTELKRSEARLRRSEELMVDTQGVAHLGTWEWDISEPTAIWSSELYRIYGLTPQTYTPTYEKYLEMVHPEDRQRVMDATNRVFHEHVPYSHDERIFRPDGSMRHLHTWAHPVLDDAGKLVRLVGVCQDITDQKLAEEAVQRSNAELERRVADRTRTIENSLRDLEAFNAMASHDLRAPLAVIQGSCGLIRHRGAPELPSYLAENLERIERSVTHMTALVNDLLTLAHVGHAPLSREPIDLSALSRDVIEQIRQTDPERAVEVVIAPELRGKGDPDLMRTVLENLLGNAWKYSSRVAAPRIEIGTAPAARGEAFFVRDNGAGFDMSDAHRLFAPFERLHKASEFEGTGVGLAGAFRIIERHGGRIWAEAAVDRGATFFFELPPN